NLIRRPVIKKTPGQASVNHRTASSNGDSDWLPKSRVVLALSANSVVPPARRYRKPGNLPVESGVGVRSVTFTPFIVDWPGGKGFTQPRSLGSAKHVPLFSV